jgi:hypothetical protein
MDAVRAAKLRRDWDGKPCDHAALEPEYMNGIQTGDYVCMTCGESGIGRDWNKKTGSKPRPPIDFD